MTDYPQVPYSGPPVYPDGNPLGYGPRGPADDQLWSMLSYLLSFVAALIAPLIIYLVKINESRYVRYHAAQALNMAITGVIYGFGGVIVGIVLALATHGIALLILVPLFIAYAIAHVVYLILGAVHAYRGELFRVPGVLALPLVH
jgi:uncharacterized Tic20 family protein